ncbi:MAG: two-component sensor histidine kinase [Crocinitomix sp.]|jgi:two-component sensor histidine kinase
MLRKRHNILLVIFLLLGSTLFSQETNPEIDSLANVSNDITRHDTIRLDAMFKLSAKLLFVDGDSSFSVIEEQMKLALKQEDKKWLATTYFKRCDYHSYISGQLDSALIDGWRCMALAEEANATRLSSTINNLVGIIYRDIYPDSALYYYQKSIDISMENNDYKGLSGRYINKGIVYEGMGDFMDAIESIQIALRFLDYFPNDSWKSNAYNAMGNIYLSIKDWDKAENYYRKGIILSDSVGNSAGFVFFNLNLVSVCLERNGENDVETADSSFQRANRVCEELDNIYLTQSYHQIKAHYLQSTGYPEESKVFGEIALELAEKIQNTEAIGYVKSVLGQVENDLGNYKAAIKYCEEAYESSQNTNDIVGSGKACNCLYDAHVKLNNKGEALKYHILFTEINDSILDLDNARGLAERELEFFYNQKQLSDSIAVIEANKIVEIEHLQTLEGEKQSKIVLFAIVGVLVIGIFFIYREIRRKRKQAVVLNVKNKLIKESLTEKELLLKEIHHRVKNNFQTISSLLDLQSKDIEDSKALETISEGKDRIRAMALIHQKLYQNDNISTLDFQNYIEQLVEQIVNTYSLHELEMEIYAENCHLDIDTAIPLGLILNELVTNACKYAFNLGSGKLIINLDLISKGTYSLTVRDNGEGILGDIDFSKLKSLGLRLVGRLAKQLQGSFSYDYDQGSVFEIIFKDTMLRKELD